MAFRSYNEIEDYRIDESQYLRTGIKGIDKAILGFGLGQLVIITGTRAGGKTTLIGNITDNFIEQGYSGLLCSFEMTNPRLKNWLMLQALGADNLRGFTTSTGKEIFCPRTKTAKEAVGNWIDAKLKIYDNHDFDVDKIFEDVTAEVKKNPKIKFIILDNLMKMEFDGSNEDKWSTQSRIVRKLQNYAQKENICVILVAHPNKVKTMPRIEDVGGSGDIINTADTVLIVHRVTEDFKKRAWEHFRWKADDPELQYPTLIEIAKDREFGDDDSFIGVFFEPRSKRFLNYPGENIRYGWDVSPTQEHIRIGKVTLTELSEDVETPF